MLHLWHWYKAPQIIIKFSDAIVNIARSLSFFFLAVQLSELLCLTFLHCLCPEGYEAFASGECEKQKVSIFFIFKVVSYSIII